jgi:hypothetical protein
MIGGTAPFPKSLPIKSLIYACPAIKWWPLVSIRNPRESSSYPLNCIHSIPTKLASFDWRSRSRINGVRSRKRRSTTWVGRHFFESRIGRATSRCLIEFVTAHRPCSKDLFDAIRLNKFKSGPRDRHPLQGPRPDHVLDPNYDPMVSDVPGLELLGARQIKFLEEWGAQTDATGMKAVLSQTGFCGGAHLHGSKDNRLHADLDSNGWPQTGRNQALRTIQKAGAIHLAGDQHLATLIQHGIEDFGDGPWAFVVPAIVNNYYRRWWWPADEQPGANRASDSPLPWTGDYLDGFDIKITMHAYVNPESDSAGGGYGLVRFEKSTRQVTFECWPRYAHVTQPEAQQFPGWPRTISMDPANN